MNDEIMRKVAKLLRLAQSDNANEAAQAAARAQELIDRYKLGAVDMDFDLKGEEHLPDEPVQDFEDPLAVMGRRVESWRARLAIALADANQCVVAYVRHPQGKAMQIVGRPSDATTVRYLFGYLSKEVERLALLKRGNGRTWINNYKIGVVEGISEAIELQKRATVDRLRQEAGQGTALMRIDRSIQKLEERALSTYEYFMRTRKRRTVYGYSTDYSQFDAGARAAGRRDGSKLNVGGTSRKYLE